MNSKRLASSLCAAAFVGVLGILVASSYSAPVKDDPCVGCGTEKIITAITGNANVDRANLAKAYDAAMLVQRKNVERAAVRQRAKNNVWKGTKLHVKMTETDPDTIALHGSICRVFSSDPTPPAARTNAIQAYTGQYASLGIRCTGYCGHVESVTPNGDGWRAVVRVTPQLAGGYPVVRTTYGIVEEWQIGKDGSLKNLSCKPEPVTNSIIGG